MEYEEQRQSERFISNISVEEIEPGGSTKFCRAINLSRGGALLVSEEKDPEKSQGLMWLKFHLPCYDTFITTRAKVVHDSIIGRRHYRGVCFEDLSSEHRHLLNAYTSILRIDQTNQ